MKRTTGNDGATFKAKVAVAALTGHRSLAGLAQQCDVHVNQITQWRSHLQERASDVFATARERPESTGPNFKELHVKIGQVAVENDFWAAALGRLGRSEKQRDAV